MSFFCAGLWASSKLWTGALPAMATLASYSYLCQKHHLFSLQNESYGHGMPS
jgi:hypothetical protein